MVYLLTVNNEININKKKKKIGDEVNYFLEINLNNLFILFYFFRLVNFIKALNFFTTEKHLCGTHNINKLNVRFLICYFLKVSLKKNWIILKKFYALISFAQFLLGKLNDKTFYSK